MQLSVFLWNFIFVVLCSFFLRNFFLSSQVFVPWRVVSLSRFQFTPRVQSILSFVFGFILMGGTVVWMFLGPLNCLPSYSQYFCVTLIPPFLCGIYVGLFFRDRNAKLLSIVFVMLLSLSYPIFNITLPAFRCPYVPNYHFVVTNCIFAGNLLFVGMIKLVNFIFFRLSARTGESSVFSRNWYRFKEGKLFFATWVHFSILRIAPLIIFGVLGRLNDFYNILAVFILSQGIALLFFFYWQKARDNLYPPTPTEPFISKP